MSNERLDRVEQSLQPTASKTPCPLCFRPKEGFDDIVQDVVKKAFLTPLGLDKCNNTSHEITLIYKQELEDVIRFIWDSLELNQSELYMRNGFGYTVCDVDIEKPRELIKLFADWEVMEFVLKRYYDDKIKSDKFGGMFAMVNGEVWKGHDVIISARYWEDKSRYAVSYQNSENIFKSLDKDWLASLDPSKYDWYKNIPEKRRHRCYTSENITMNSKWVNEAREEYRQWLELAEAELGRKHIYKSFEC